MPSSSSMDLLFALILLASPAALAKSSPSLPAIFTFGDSIFDAGNNHFNKNCTAQADFPPYGSSFFHQPTGRFTNGRTVADFICNYISQLFNYSCFFSRLLVLQGTLLFSHFLIPCSAIHRSSTTETILGTADPNLERNFETIPFIWHQLRQCR